MHQYWYVNSKSNRELYNAHIAIPPLYSQPQIPKLGGINGLEIPEDWSCRVYPTVWDSSADHAGFNFQQQPFPWAQSFHHAGMMPQGHLASWAPLAGHADFNSPKQPLPWAQPFHHAGMFPHGPFSALPPFATPFSFSANGQPMNWNAFGNHAGWGGQGNAMGWGNNGGNGQPGMLENLLTMGKGTMNGIGMISSLIGMGKFFF
ncbi:hypothetical protein [Bacillus cereus]|uniref:Group-specific protein n=1 Tax=Bacillus cereus HuA4-10 TaxID=1053206 RepID=J8DUD4_BACCE|nr:hypothetical protein [Bacillus cereus]EJQ79944.1 hypothetical protein IGC_02515 [Bacillus cereus HuA4-10]